jgi:HSP20 family molecular chaperone IbpA
MDRLGFRPLSFGSGSRSALGLRDGGESHCEHVPIGHDFVLPRDAMRQMLQESFVLSGGSRHAWSNGSQAMARPLPLDVYATPDEAVDIAAVPGMSPENLEITYTDNTLTLSGTVPGAAESEPGQKAT